MIVVHVVEIVWTKATRGAPRANERAALPRAFAVAPVDAAYLVQYRRMSEDDGFRCVLTKACCADRPPATETSLRLTLADASTLQLGLGATFCRGQPPRKPQSLTLQLVPGETARLWTNARHTSYSGQHYTETIYHVAFGNVIAPDCFLRGAPDREFDQRADLF